MPVDPDQIFRDLSSNSYLASYELLKRLETSLIQGAPSSSDYTEACGILEAFYEAQAWKPPPPLNANNVSVRDIDDTANMSRARPRLQYEAFVAQIMQNYRFVMKEKATAALKSTLANEPGYAVLEGEEKKELHQHIQKIRRPSLKVRRLMIARRTACLNGSTSLPARSTEMVRAQIDFSHLQAN
ncbi:MULTISPECIES: hypothetical protein [unclassified Bradyrhizobium]|uniref:hypothetical protein n=1 Tax=unclassified Bradyrhizobium TaxID=2631580 RepID=UPI002916BAB0|nr:MULTISPECIES: hypothetical protein [unclassified Bradyrhizobium]